MGWWGFCPRTFCHPLRALGEFSPCIRLCSALLSYLTDRVVRMLIKIGKRPTRRRSTSRKRVASPQLRATRVKDPCYCTRLTDESLRKAEAESTYNLDLLDGKLRCADCGAFVSARYSEQHKRLVLVPSPHARYKAPPDPPRKRDYSKRVPR